MSSLHHELIGFCGDLDDVLHKLGERHGEPLLKIIPVTAGDGGSGINSEHPHTVAAAGKGQGKIPHLIGKHLPELWVIAAQQPHHIPVFIEIAKEHPCCSIDGVLITAFCVFQGHIAQNPANKLFRQGFHQQIFVRIVPIKSVAADQRGLADIVYRDFADLLLPVPLPHTRY